MIFKTIFNLTALKKIFPSYKVYVTHIFVWALYLVYAYLIELWDNPQNRFLDILFANLSSIWTFYSGYYFLNSLIAKRNYSKGTGLLLLSISGCGVIEYVYYNYLLKWIGIAPYETFNLNHFTDNVVRIFVKYLIFAAGYFFAMNAIKKEKELRQMEKRNLELEHEKLEIEYAFLRSQINPHFLHNTLSLFYSKSLSYSQELSEGILTLSEIMRYSLQGREEMNRMVLLDTEVEHLLNVIKLHQLRFGNKLKIDWSLKGDIHHISIIPLVLITLVENAFKHGELTNEQYPLQIHLEVSEDNSQIKFFTENKKKSGPKELSHGIGLDNIRRRLDWAYGSSYLFTISEDSLFYKTELTIHPAPHQQQESIPAPDCNLKLQESKSNNHKLDNYDYLFNS